MPRLIKYARETTHTEGEGERERERLARVLERKSTRKKRIIKIKVGSPLRDAHQLGTLSDSQLLLLLCSAVLCSHAPIHYYPAQSIKMLRQRLPQRLRSTWRRFGSSHVAVPQKNVQPRASGLVPRSHSTDRPSSVFRRRHGCAFSTTASDEPALKSDVDVITTPIFYVNAAPHLGHLYTALLCDARARWSRMQGRKVLFTTGTDEHGLKIEEAAEKNGFDSPLLFCDTVAKSFESCFDEFGISHDDFVRTTEPRHLETVQALWRRLKANGVIYLGTHCGWYCKSDESYLTEAQTVELDEDGNIVSPGITDQEAGPLAQQLLEEEALAAQADLLCEQARPSPPKKGVTRVSLESGHPVEYFEEENFMFKLSAFEEPLLQWLEKTLPSASVVPATRRNEVLGFVRSGLQDFSVSRYVRKLEESLSAVSSELLVLFYIVFFVRNGTSTFILRQCLVPGLHRGYGGESLCQTKKIT